MNTTTLTPDQQKILQIAERYNAYPGSGGLHIRGIEDVLEFADEVQGLALEEVETLGIKNIKASTCKESIYDKLQDAAQASPWLMVGDSWVQWCIDFMRSKRITHEAAQAICSDLPKRPVLITDPLKIHDTFEHDQQCDDMAGVPHIPT